MLQRLFLISCLLCFSIVLFAQPLMEDLDRGIVAFPDNKGKVFISWRLLGTEDKSLAFNLYKTTNKKTIQLNKSPIVSATNFTDENVDSSQVNIYTVKAILNGKEEKNRKLL